MINDSPIKQFAENTHAVGPGTVEAFMRITNRITNGRHVTVFGYGSVGRGVAMYFRNFFSVVSVVEPQPVLQLRAVLDGMVVPGREAALADADVIVTVTGAPGVVTAADLAHLRDGAVLMNAGHLPWEIDVPGLTADPSVASADETTDGITTLRPTRRPRDPPADRRAHGQPGRAAAARQLDRVDGSRLHAAGPLPRSRRERLGRRDRRASCRCRPRSTTSSRRRTSRSSTTAVTADEVI